MPVTITVKRKDLPVSRPQTIKIGTDWEGEKFYHKNPDGSAINLTGAVVSGRLQLANGTVIDLVMVVDAAAGSYTPTLPKETTTSFTAQTAKYEIDVVDSLGKKHCYWDGPVTIKPTIPAAGA
jgi:hypothetical protein